MTRKKRKEKPTSKNAPKPPPRLSAATWAHFWAWTAPVDDSADSCWGWLGACDRKGYGLFWAPGTKRGARGRTVRATRIACSPPPKAGEQVLHSCDNPTCCNPAHLRPGRAGENNRERAARKRSAWGAKNGQAKLTEEQAIEIRRRWRAGESASLDLAPEFGVSATTVRHIGQGRAWKLAGDDTNETLEGDLAAACAEWDDVIRERHA